MRFQNGSNKEVTERRVVHGPGDCKYRELILKKLNHGFRHILPGETVW